MVGSSRSGPVIRHSFVRAAPRGRLRRSRRAKNDPFSSVPGGSAAAPATKPAHLLRFPRYPRPHPRFKQNRRRSTCGFVFAFFGMVGDRQLNVVDGPILWRALLLRAQKCRHGEGRRLRGGWGWGGGYVFGSPAAARGPWPRALSVRLALTDAPDQGTDAGHGDDKRHE